MAEIFEPPPTFADPVLVETKKVAGKEVTHAQFNPIWLKWFLDLANYISLNGAGGILQHNTLGGLQGGQANEYYHLTAAQEGLLANAQNAGAVLSGPFSGAPGVPTFLIRSYPRRKTTPTSITNNTVLANDADLVFPIGANEEWIGRVYAAVGAAFKTTGVQVSVAAPAGATGGFHASIISDSASVQEVDVLANNALGVSANFPGLSGANYGFIELAFRVVNGATAGNVNVQFAQSTSSATALTIYDAGTQLTANRIL